ncbi:MAG: aldolase, partial [Nitrospirae bacterium]
MRSYARELAELKSRAGDILRDGPEGLRIADENRLREELIDYLIYTLVFSEDLPARKEAHRLIWLTALSLGVYPASIHPLYMAMGREETGGFTTAAMNFRSLTYDVCQRVFKVAEELKAGAFIFEIAKSEMEYTFQSPAEYTACVLAASVKTGYKGPVFIQGDHFQFSVEGYRVNPDAEIEALKSLCKRAVDAGFLNIDIDASTLVDYSKQTVTEQQYHNYYCTARLTEYLREIEPEGVTISVGAEIGHIGGKNSTVEEARAFMEGFKGELGQGITGVSKLSVQTGTAHGGVPLPDGSVAEVNLDFEVLRSIGEFVRRQYGLSGTVQHGASTLPEELFDRFPQNNCSEIHLATGFQNIMYEFAPEELKSSIYSYIKESFSKDWKEGMTEQQFLYKTRKRGFGPFKKKWWFMEESSKNRILDEIEKKLNLLFTKLNLKNTKEEVQRYVAPV